MDSHAGRFADGTFGGQQDQPTVSSAGDRDSSSAEMELWEPPFERWLKLADDLLRDWSSRLPALRH